MKGERERVINFLCGKNMDWTKNLYGLKNKNLYRWTSLSWNLNTFDEPPTNAASHHVGDIQISFIHVFFSTIASLA